MFADLFLVVGVGRLGQRRAPAAGPAARSATGLTGRRCGGAAESSDGTDCRRRIAQRVAADRVIPTVDPDTRHVHESLARRQNGLKAHVVVEPDTGTITRLCVGQACGGR
jgi:hypothetical protein